MVEAVILDVDGTLIDNNLLHALAWRRSFERGGKVVDASSLIHRIGMGSDKLPLDVLGEEEAEAAEEIGGYHSEEYSEKGLIEHSQPFPGAAQLLVVLRERDMKIALASSGKQKEIARYLEMIGGPEAVDEIVTMEEASGSKPEPDIFATAWEKLGRPQSAVAIGDTIYDVQAAAKLGIPCVAVLSGGIEREILADAGAVAVYDNAADVIAHLDDVLNPPEPDVSVQAGAAASKA